MKKNYRKTLGAEPRNFEVENRWTHALVEDGFTAVSNYFLENYARLQPKLTPVEAMLVVHLMKYKWDQNMPFPRFSVLAEQMGMHESGVRTCARKLEAKGCLKRNQRGGQPNQFDLTPLFSKLEALKESEKAAKKAAEEAALRGHESDGVPVPQPVWNVP